MHVALVIATNGRASLLKRMAPHWLQQSRAPARIVIAAAEPGDVGDLGAVSDRIEVIYARRGSCCQRNAALDRLEGTCPVVVFLDDDFVPSGRLVEGVSGLFSNRPDVMVATGLVLADGINTPGIPFKAAVEMVADHDARQPPGAFSVEPYPHGYGCNLAVRIDEVPDIRFDERLPLYGWQEDLDFSRRLGARGRIVGSNAFAGVHMGLKAGRISGVRLGYSQVANPVYLRAKQVMSRGEVWTMVSRNMAKNVARTFWPEPWIDRRGRLVGNLLALRDAATGRLQPERILEL